MKLPPYSQVMTDSEFDAALVATAFSIGAERGWRFVFCAVSASWPMPMLWRAR
jgi:hypothetical protein